MLGKLLKHEFKDTAKIFLPLNAIMLVFAALSAGLLKIGILDHMEFLQAFLMMLYIVGIMSLFIITAVYLSIRFYKTMYASQGYLTHTLPASPLAILNSKIFTALSWLILALLVCLLSVLILIFSLSGFPTSAEFFAFRSQLETVFGIGIFPSVCLLASVFISFCFDMGMMVFASLSVGQLFHQYRIPAAVVTGIIFYVVQQTSSAVLLLFLGIGLTDAQESVSNLALIETSALYRNILLLSAGAMLLFGIIYYVICYVITKKKLNLE